jgi:uncharacterized protein YcbK (DUF882 family)
MSFPQEISEYGHEFNRRRFIKLSALGALGLLLPGPGFAAMRDYLKAERSISLYNIHTGESLQAVYWAQGKYVPGSLEELNHIFRDHRTGEIKPLDTRLLDLLHAIGVKLKTAKPFNIISGYRSPKTNAFLRRRSRGVDANSFHMYGKAADVRVPGYSLSFLRRVAMDLTGGGVGYYPRSNFVHVDVGPVRFW